MANNDYNDNENENDDSPVEPSRSELFTPIIHENRKKHRFDKRRKMKRPPVTNLDAFLTPPSPKQFAEPPSDSFKRKQSSVLHVNRASERATNSNQPVLIGNDDLPEIVPPPNFSNTERSNKKVFSQPTTNKNAPIQRVTTSKVLIKRVNYNYHPIIDFFFRDRAVKTPPKTKENNRVGHSIK